jgi:succinate dehydrogenase/fumarate reductase flavoprotein subunit
MTTWQEFLAKEGRPPKWPYPIRYDQEQEIETDVLVLGGGIAGCWAAIAAAREGVSVAMVEKGATERSGAGGAGVDHWNDCCLSPLSKIDPDEFAEWRANLSGGYTCGIARQIQMRENYDTLLEMENMGGKIRDYDDEYIGAEGRDDKTKFMISPRLNPFHETESVIRVWGTTFKPALKKECQRLGVKIYDRVMATSLLNEKGVQGNKVVGATGFNTRTGEFMVFKSKATILSAAGPSSVWLFNTELAGITTFRPRNVSGDGYAMAWKAGAELTMMEMTRLFSLGGGFKHHWYGGAGDASYENVPIVDDNGKLLPGRYEGWGQGREEILDGSITMQPGDKIREMVLKGELSLPFYGDFPSMPEVERRATWGLMIGEESRTKIITQTYNESGFDKNTDLLQNYRLIEGTSPAQWRSVDSSGGRGGILTGWDMETTLEGLYSAGDQLPNSGDHNLAATTGRYAGRKAATYTKQVEGTPVPKEQVAKEKARVFAPIKRTEGVEWKELHAGIARTMQYFCSEFKTEKLFDLGLEQLQDIEEKFVPKLYAAEPHKLMRSLEDLSILAVAQCIMHASKARKASSRYLGFNRIDYPELDPPEWNKFLTVRLEDDKVKIGERPLGFWGNLKEGYEARNKDYKGVYKV